MTYSVIGSGRRKIGQSQAIYDDLSQQEVTRNTLNDQMRQAKKAERNSVTSTAAGVIAADIAAGAGAATVGTSVGTAAAATGAGAATAGAAGAAGSGAGVLAAMGPMGWAALAGLAAYAIFS